MAPRPARPGSKPTPQSSLRIIAGQWRGRRLQFPTIDGLRPTPDRVRETLFNWLMPVIAGTRCLDLFAGSGALGLEALSRGAAAATFVDQSTQVKQSILANLHLLGCEQAQVYAADTLNWLQHPPQGAGPYDLVFLDPPFRKDLLKACAARLEEQSLLRDQAWIYIEAEQELRSLPVPDNWRLHRHKIAGQVQYALFQRELPAS